MKTALLVITITFTAGCGPVKYKGPDSGPRASLTFVNKSSDKITTEIYKGAEQCTDRIITGHVQPSENKAITIPANQESAFSIINSSLSRNIAIGVGGVLVATTTDDLYANCSPSIKFHPKDGVSYRLYLEETEGVCKFKFTKEVANQKEQPLQPNEFVLRKWTRAWGESGPWCVTP